MASATYENILREVEQLTPEERGQLREVLNTTARPSGADFIAFLETVEPIRPEALDSMEAAIKELEEINVDDQ